jgi:uncharacterized spore protein YtfJ
MKEQEGVSVRDRPGQFLVRIAEAIGGHAGVSSVFAPPVTQDGTTVIAVGQMIWGFGGGEGTKKAENTPAESGSGGGGGAVVRPVGFIVLRNGKVKYRRITAIPALLLAAAAGAAVAMLLRRE